MRPRLRSRNQGSMIRIGSSKCVLKSSAAFMPRMICCFCSSVICCHLLFDERVGIEPRTKLRKHSKGFALHCFTLLKTVQRTSVIGSVADSEFVRLLRSSFDHLVY